MTIEMNIFAASIRGDLNRIIELLDAGEAQVNEEDVWFYPPLHATACHGHIECMIELIKRGANIDLVDSGITPLRAAIANNQKSSVMTLISYAKNKREFILNKNQSGWTALHSSANFDHDDIFELLLEYVNVDDLEIKDDLGRTALDLTMSAKIKKLIEDFKTIPIAKYLK